MSFDLVIFDNDGVLVDSEPISCRIVSELLCEWGYATTPERCLADFQGGSFARLREIIQQRTGRRLPEDFYPRYQELLFERFEDCLLYTSPSPRDVEESRMPSSA